MIIRSLLRIGIPVLMMTSSPAMGLAQDTHINPVLDAIITANENDQSCANLACVPVFHKGQRTNYARTNFVAHRGYWHADMGSYGSVTPLLENSPRAIWEAYDRGIPAIEVDVRVSQDDVAFAMHDVTLGRLMREYPLDDSRNVRTLTALQIRSTYSRICTGFWIFRSCMPDYSAHHLEVARRAHDMVAAPRGSGRSLTVVGAIDLESVLSTIHDEIYDPGGRAVNEDTIPNVSGHYMPLIILDIQDMHTAQAAARLVVQHNLQDWVVLKIFAARVTTVNPSQSVTSSPAEWFFSQMPAYSDTLNYIIQINDSQIKNCSLFECYLNIEGYARAHRPRDFIADFDDYLASRMGNLIGIGLSTPSNPPEEATGHLESEEKRDYVEQLYSDLSLGYLNGNGTGRRMRLATFGVSRSFEVVSQTGCEQRLFQQGSHNWEPFNPADSSMRNEFASETDFNIADITRNQTGNYIIPLGNEHQSMYCAE
ncbi:glycerophosphodiester phosphodiesterase [Oceanicaulis sp.]|uniref:glycerophosphodiester phosphodiesterase n=1 Tax=Oceanicaulis sp. TaxID=1924941 RepID=UPI003F71C2D6